MRSTVMKSTTLLIMGAVFPALVHCDCGSTSGYVVGDTSKSWSIDGCGVGGGPENIPYGEFTQLYIEKLIGDCYVALHCYSNDGSDVWLGSEVAGTLGVDGVVYNSGDITTGMLTKEHCIGDYNGISYVSAACYG